MKYMFKIGIPALVVLALMVFAFGSGDASAIHLKCKQVVSDPDAGAFTIRCRGATVFYNAGTCTGKCAGIPSLPFDAKDALQALEVLVPASFVYVRMVDENKVPIDRWVTICFDAGTIDDVHNPKLRYYDTHTNSWLPQFNRLDPDSGAMCTEYFGEFSMAVLGGAK